MPPTPSAAFSRCFLLLRFRVLIRAHVQEARGCKWGGSDSAQKRPRARPRDAPSAYKPNNSLDTQTQRADSVRRHQRRASPLSQQETARDGGGGTSHAPEETEGDRSDSSKS
jgi:hypothetical protein